jgi:phosphoribosylglycinamide formyltransferase-1
MKIAVIISTNGGVISKLLNYSYFRNKVACFITDRKCGAIELADKYGIEVIYLPSKSGMEFSDKILGNIDVMKFDLIISFYTRLFKGELLKKVKYKLINMHPSILPACPGMHGFEDTVKSGARFVGATVHFVDEGIDTGFPIIQSARPFNPTLDINLVRHLVFIDQCKILLQAIRWFDDKRIVINEHGAYVTDASYEVSPYSPNLDFEEAIFIA